MTFYSDFEHAVNEIHRAVSPYFTRAEPRLRALRYMLGLSGITAGFTKPRRNIASTSGEARTDGAQRLLTTARWDESAVRAKLVDLVKENAGPGGDLYVIETSFAKKGQSAVATEPQFSADGGHIETCQNAVLMFYGAVDGCLFLLDVDLYVPPSWTDNEERRRQVKIPSHVVYRSKSRIACDMVARAMETGLEPGRVSLSLRCSAKQELLRWLRQRRVEYVTQLAAGEFRDLATIGSVMSNGTVVTDRVVASDTTPWSPTIAYYRACSRGPLSDNDMDRRVAELRKMDLRWKSMRQQLGIGRYEVRSWRGWQRHMTLAMAVQIALQLACHHNRPRTPLR